MGRHKMTATQAFKKRFVERRLAPVLAEATKGEVTDCLYEARGDDELVKVLMSSPVRGPRVLRVNVSCDSE